MLAQASSYIDRVIASYQKHCCCTSDPRDDQGKSGDVVVFTDWDTREDAATLPGRELIPEPAAIGAAAMYAAAASGKLGQSAEAPDLHGRTPVRDGFSNRPSPQQSPDILASQGLSESLPEGVAEAFELRELMKRFVQEMIRGKSYHVVVENGQTEPCVLCITTALQYLQLRAAGVTHDIPLRHVKNIVPGRLLENRFTPIHLDELCATIVLRNNECVTFRLSSLKERDDFTKCIKVLVLALE
mmetsp:Transcript_45491/g.105467  ORF Transcript_45491/g.105467 Transcript_45491/m.105467 type:complete len:243 (+) Transcript_45491:98-826(+)